MTTVKVYDHFGEEMWDYFPDFNVSNITNVTDTKIVIKYDDATYPNENEGRPYKMVAVGTGIVVEDGQVVAGTLTKLLMYDQSGNLIQKFTNFSMDASLYQSYFNRENNDSLQYNLMAGDDLITGSGGDDDLLSGLGNDTVNARGGDDWIADAGGQDIYNGGAGTDTVSYQNIYWNAYASNPTGIQVNLAAGTIVGPDGFTDTVSGIEKVYGTYMKDTFIGNAQNNRFKGFQGRDDFNGKGGYDLLDYSNDVNFGGYLGIRANLAKGIIRDGFGDRDTVKNIEAVKGTEFNDTMLGSARDEWLGGEEGDDILKGKGGNDQISGLAGADQMWGGAGADEFIYEFADESASGHVDTIWDFEVGVDDIVMTDVLDGVFTFIGNSAFSNTAGELRTDVSGSDTYIRGDVDGDGVADFIVFVANVTNMTAGDFVL